MEISLDVLKSFDCVSNRKLKVCDVSADIAHESAQNDFPDSRSELALPLSTADDQIKELKLYSEECFRKNSGSNIAVEFVELDNEEQKLWTKVEDLTDIKMHLELLDDLFEW